MREPAAPNDPVAPAHQLPHDTSQPSQERSLVLFHHQSPDFLSRPVSPAHPMWLNDPPRETARRLSPTTTLPIVEDSTDRGTVTPKLGNTTLYPPSQGGSQGPAPPRRDKGKYRMVQPYSDEEGMSEPEEDRNAGVGGLPPRERPGQVCPVSLCFGD